MVGDSQARASSNQDRKTQEIPVEPSNCQFQCGACGAELASEELARAHISRSDDSTHQNLNGFAPEATVYAITPDGESIELGFDPMKRKGDVTVDDIPDEEFSAKEQIILATAIQNPQKSYSNIHEDANERLLRASYTEVSQNQVYRLVRDALDVRSSRTNNSDGDGFASRTEKQKRVLVAAAKYPDKEPRELAKIASVSSTYPANVLDKYGDIVEDDLRNRDSLPDILDEDSQQNESELEQKFNNCGAVAKKLIEEIARNRRRKPSEKKDLQEIEEDVGCGSGYVSKVKKEHEELIQWKSEQLATEEDEESDSSVAKSETESILSDYTPKTAAVIKELAKEDTPTDPDRTLTEIAEAAEESVSVSHVSNVKRDEAETIKQVKMAKSGGDSNPSDMETQPDMAVTSNSVMSASPTSVMEETSEKETVESNVSWSDSPDEPVVDESESEDTDEKVSDTEDDTGSNHAGATVTESGEKASGITQVSDSTSLAEQIQQLKSAAEQIQNVAELEAEHADELTASHGRIAAVNTLLPLIGEIEESVEEAVASGSASDFTVSDD